MCGSYGDNMSGATVVIDLGAWHTQVMAKALLCGWLGQVRACIQRCSTGITVYSCVRAGGPGSEDGFPSGPGLLPTPRVTLPAQLCILHGAGDPRGDASRTGLSLAKDPGLYSSSLLLTCGSCTCATVSQVVSAGLLALNILLRVPFPTHISLPTSWFPAAIRIPKRAG